MTLLKSSLSVLEALTRREDLESSEDPKVVSVFTTILYPCEDPETIEGILKILRRFCSSKWMRSILCENKNLIVWVLSFLQKSLEREREALKFIHFLCKSNRHDPCLHVESVPIILKHLDHRNTIDYYGKVHTILKILQLVTQSSDRYLFHIAFYRDWEDQESQSLLDKLQWILYFGLRMADTRVEKLSTDWRETLYICLNLLHRCSKHPGLLTEMVQDHRVTFAFMMVVKQKHGPDLNVFAIELIRRIHELKLRELQDDQNFLTFVKDHL